MPSHVRDVDKGYAELVRRVYGFGKPRVDVGILEGPGGQAHGDDAATVLEIAVFNEFGTDDIPARSFIRAWFDENQEKIRANFAKLMESALKGTRTKEQILQLLGQWCVGQIQERISAGIPPPNAPSTIAKKGSSTPLIAQGILRGAINYRVGDGPSGSGE